jgi:membrane protein insertase Oxa1/YidC/SpoIIIJ
LIQIPVFITLFYVFRNDLNVHLDSLYSFVQFPSHPSQHFLGLFDLNVNKNYVLALLTGLTQFIQTKLTLPVSPKAKTELGQGSFADDLTRSMSLQMTYVMPIFIAFIATTLPAAVSLYWVTSNTISIVLELWWRKRQKKSK